MQDAFESRQSVAQEVAANAESNAAFPRLQTRMRVDTTTNFGLQERMLELVTSLQSMSDTPSI